MANLKSGFRAFKRVTVGLSGGAVARSSIVGVYSRGVQLERNTNASNGARVHQFDLEKVCSQGVHSVGLPVLTIESAPIASSGPMRSSLKTFGQFIAPRRVDVQRR